MRVRAPSRCRVLPVSAWLVCVASLLLPMDARAERRDLAVIQGTTAVTPELAAAVDAALLKGLVEVAGIQAPLVSPVSYAEVQLSVGCEDESVSCLTSIAQTADVDAVVVRQLSASGTDTVQLRLVYFKPATQQPPSHVELSGPRDAPAALTRPMPDLIRRLLGLGMESAGLPASAASGGRHTSAQNGERSVKPLTWVTLAAGVSLLVPGIALAVAADADYDDFRTSSISTRADADRAHDDFDSIRDPRHLVAGFDPRRRRGAGRRRLAARARPDRGSAAEGRRSRAAVRGSTRPRRRARRAWDPGRSAVTMRGLLLLTCASWALACSYDLDSHAAACHAGGDCPVGQQCYRGFCIDPSLEADSGGGACEDGALPETCYDGPADTEGRGACRAGKRFCVQGALTACFDQVTPSAEICNGKDDDCNGNIDDIASQSCQIALGNLAESRARWCVGGARRLASWPQRQRPSLATAPMTTATGTSTRTREPLAIPKANAAARAARWAASFVSDCARRAHSRAATVWRIATARSRRPRSAAPRAVPPSTRTATVRSTRRATANRIARNPALPVERTRSDAVRAVPQAVRPARTA